MWHIRSLQQTMLVRYSLSNPRWPLQLVLLQVAAKGCHLWDQLQRCLQYGQCSCHLQGLQHCPIDRQDHLRQHLNLLLLYSSDKEIGGRSCGRSESVECIYNARRGSMAPRTVTDRAEKNTISRHMSGHGTKAHRNRHQANSAFLRRVSGNSIRILLWHHFAEFPKPLMSGNAGIMSTKVDCRRVEKSPTCTYSMFSASPDCILLVSSHIGISSPLHL